MQNIGTICVSSILLIHTHHSNKRGGRGNPIREGDKYVWTNWHRGHWSVVELTKHHQLLFFQTSDWIKSFYHFGKFVKTKGWDPGEPSGEGGSKGEIVYTRVYTVLYSLLLTLWWTQDNIICSEEWWCTFVRFLSRAFSGGLYTGWPGSNTATGSSHRAYSIYLPPSPRPSPGYSTQSLLFYLSKIFVLLDTW